MERSIEEDDEEAEAEKDIKDEDKTELTLSELWAVSQLLEKAILVDGTPENENDPICTAYSKFLIKLRNRGEQTLPELMERAIDRQLLSIENTEDVQAWVNRLTNSPIEAKLAAVMGELFNITMFDLSPSDRVRQEPETRISLNIGWACDDVAIELEEAASDWTKLKRYEFAIAMLKLLKGGDRPASVLKAHSTSDLEFLLEMQWRLNDGVDRRDPTQIQFVQQMISDWISELKGTIRLP